VCPLHSIKVATIIAETCDIPRDNDSRPESHAIDDWDRQPRFLDIAFAIDKAFGIKLPLKNGRRKSTTERRRPNNTLS